MEIELPQTATAPATWELYETTREPNCQKVNTIPVRNANRKSSCPPRLCSLW